MQDLYEVLGVQRGAPVEDIKRSYRRLVRECHPDLNPSRSAERRFKAVSQAYSVLSDPDQRALYDEFGSEALQPGFDAVAARHWKRTQQERRNPHQGDFGDMSAFSDIFSSIFDDPPEDPASGSASNGVHTDDLGFGSGRKQPTEAQDEHVEATLNPLISFTGGSTTVSVVRANGRTESLRIRVQAGVRSGDTVQIPGGGGSSVPWGPPSDLVVTLNIPDHPLLRRKGDDLEMDVPVTLLEAVQGGVITVPTPTGLAQVNLPPNCAGAKLRLRNRGVQRASGPGHLILHLRPQLPDRIDAEIIDACRSIERAYSGDIRDALRL